MICSLKNHEAEDEGDVSVANKLNRKNFRFLSCMYAGHLYQEYINKVNKKFIIKIYLFILNIQVLYKHNKLNN